MGRIVIVAYKPKPDQGDALKLLMKTHLTILQQLGLATDRESILMEATDGTIIECFEWVSDEAIQNAHSHPEVLKMWALYAEVCDYVPIAEVPEASSLFSSFKPME